MISYRREDSGVITGRIFDRLVAHFGNEAIFRDIDSVPYGVDFREHVDRVLSTSDIVLAVVGPRWFGSSKWRNRLSNESDPVRVEIETALRKRIPLIPVLVLGATMPKARSLPANLRDFSYRNAVQIDADRDFDTHISRLTRAIDHVLEAARRGREALPGHGDGPESAPDKRAVTGPVVPEQQTPVAIPERANLHQARGPRLASRRYAVAVAIFLVLVFSSGVVVLWKIAGENNQREASQQEEAARQQAAEAARKQREEAARQQAAEAARKQQEEAARQQAAETVRKQQEEAARQQAAETARKQQEEAARQQAAEAARKQQEEAARKQAMAADTPRVINPNNRSDAAAFKGGVVSLERIITSMFSEDDLTRLDKDLLKKAIRVRLERRMKEMYGDKIYGNTYPLLWIIEGLVLFDKDFDKTPDAIASLHSDKVIIAQESQKSKNPN